MADDKVPPWHSYCDCYGCREGERINRAIAKLDRGQTHTQNKENEHG